MVDTDKGKIILFVKRNAPRYVYVRSKARRKAQGRIPGLMYGSSQFLYWIKLGLNIMQECVYWTIRKQNRCEENNYVRWGGEVKV